MSGEYGYLVLAKAFAYQTGRHPLFGLTLFYGRVTFHQGIMERHLLLSKQFYRCMVTSCLTSAGRHPLLKGVEHGG